MEVEYIVKLIGGLAIAVGVLNGVFVLIGKGKDKKSAESDLRKQAEEFTENPEEIQWRKKR